MRDEELVEIEARNRTGFLDGDDVPRLVARVRELEAESERRRQDRADALNVTSRDGLLSSEWVARTGKAERERDAAIARAEQAERERDELHNALVTHDRLADEVSANLRAAVDLGNRQLAEVQAQAEAMREALLAGGGCTCQVDEDACLTHRALAPDAGRALLAELAAFRAQQAHAAEILARGDACARELEGAAAELAALREVAEAARQMRGRDAAIDAALNAPGGPDVEATHSAAGERVLTQHNIDRGLAKLDAMAVPR